MGACVNLNVVGGRRPRPGPGRSSAWWYIRSVSGACRVLVRRHVDVAAGGDRRCQNVALTEDRCVEVQNSGAGQEISSLSSMIPAVLRCGGTRVRGCIGVRRVRRLRELVGVCRQRLPRCSRALRTVRDVVGVHERSKLWSVVISLPCAFPVGGHKELSHPLCIDWLRAFSSSGAKATPACT